MRLASAASRASRASRALATPSHAMDYDAFLTQTSRSRRESAIRGLQPLTRIPGMISLGAGNPSAETYPFKSATFELKDGQTVEIDGALMQKALAYGPTDGLPELVEWAKALQLREHAPPRPGDDWTVAFTNGSQDAISKTLDMLVARGDSVLVEDPSYPGTLAALHPLGPNLVGVTTDQEGLVPEALAAVLDGWERERGELPKPRVLYTVPTGHNPCGTTITAARRKAVYEIAQRHNLIILEDDPYYFLSLDAPGADGVCRPPHSFLSLDTDGRVIRFDSLSKVLFPGLRLGFATGPKPLMYRLVLHMQSASLCPSGLTQVTAFALLRQWGEAGWAAHVQSVQAFYRARRDHFLQCAERHLTGLAEWRSPQAGMFVWLRLLGVQDSKALIEGPARDAKVLLVPGQYFAPDPAKPSNCVRACFSEASFENMDEALRRLAELLRRRADGAS